LVVAIIKTDGLVKKYKELLAVDNVSLAIEDGECLGLLGPNGAGKTSLIRMIIGVSPPNKGSVRVLGKDLGNSAREIKAILGVVPQLDNLDPDLTVLQNLMTFARYFDVPKDEARRRAIEALALFELDSKLKSRIKELSGGMKRRLILARGLINRPRILILDEPTIGLDPQARHLVWYKLQELKSQGVTELLCTQNMEEAAVLCDRVAIMHQGRILSVDRPKKLIQRYVGNEILEIEVNSQDKDRIASELKSRGLDFESYGSKILVFHVGTDESIGELATKFGKLIRRPATFEDVFFRLTGRSLAE
jgi:lipooligosaccharide transport system ATP-binding protein